MRVVLASASPRRRVLLGMLGIRDLLVVPAGGEEAGWPGLPPAELVMRLSGAKAEEVAGRLMDADTVVVGADTVVVLDGRILGKPRDKDEAVSMLTALSGREHRVYTGVTVLGGDARMQSGAEETAVRFRALTQQEIHAYVETGEPMDKAGAYGVQGLASLFVEGIRGDFFNVVGLPLCRLGIMLRKAGVELL
jgi:septum formation protein